MENRELRRFYSRKPGHLSKYEWKKLIKSLITPPDPKITWVKNKKTGEWEATS